MVIGREEGIIICQVLLLLILQQIFFVKDVFLLYIDTLLLLGSGFVIAVRRQVVQVEHGDHVLKPLVSALEIQLHRNLGRPVGARQIAQVAVRVVIFWRERDLRQEVVIAGHFRRARRRHIRHELLVLSQLDLAVLLEAALHEIAAGADHLGHVDQGLDLGAQVH